MSENFFRLWQSGHVQRYERPLMVIALVFSLVMLVIGWYTAWRVNFDSAVVIAAALGSAASAFGLYGWNRGSLYFVAGAALGAGLLFPTVWGYMPMITGFVLFILLISLRMFNDTNGHE
ncbi:4-amino-4-deoxy-L-arabinose transferase-like glycosyltransferase [Trueperella bonasi]|uniref:4-amino-4-deoxy-L-arabinose transferase-like glycosyltransferase n=1 Tax=Trueperella bonasi TaxID=312286 RepID=A0ABT9NES2_9ACTO|nr:hypothetical protein [Trueperella bonasi]MDP9805710.1 4-amino-4-deoxy-L-arabinose transferase-like glycosyltransferase [Trueperella bonasi]